MTLALCNTTVAITMRSIILAACFVFAFQINARSQGPHKIFKATEYSDDDYVAIRAMVGNHKTIPIQFEKQILLALSYFPELVDAEIVFRIKHVRTPLASRPAWLSIIKANRQRQYVITISDKTMSKLSAILLQNQEFNSQVGVLGHELSHVSDFSRKNSFGLMRIGMGNLSQKFLDKFEYRTDSICIGHGLGYQLLSWSTFVRKSFHEKNYEGADNIDDPVMARERYMNPTTIRRRIAAIPMYKNL